MKNNRRQVVKLTEEQMKMVLESMVNEQTEIDLNEKRAIYKPQWDKGDHLLAWFNSKYGIESLGYSEEYVANNIIGTSLFSFKSSTSNFNVLDGRPGLDNYMKTSKPREKDAQMEVYNEYKDVPYETLRKICLNFIEKIQNNSGGLNKFMLDKKISDKIEKDKIERYDAIKKIGRDPNKLTFIGRKPKFEPSPDDDESMDEPLLPQKKTPKDEIGDYIKQMYEKFKDTNPELADDLQFISDYIDSELVNKETLSEIYNLFNKNKLTETKKIRVKLSEVKSFVNKIITETKKPKVIKLKESDIRNIVNNIVNKQKK